MSYSRLPDWYCYWESCESEELEDQVLRVDCSLCGMLGFRFEELRDERDRVIREIEEYAKDPERAHRSLDVYGSWGAMAFLDEWVVDLVCEYGEKARIAPFDTKEKA